MKKLVLLTFALLLALSSYAQDDEYRFVIMDKDNGSMVSLTFNGKELTRRQTALSFGEVIANTFKISKVAYSPTDGVVFYTRDAGNGEEVCAVVNSNSTGSTATFTYGTGGAGVRTKHPGGPHEKFAASFERLKKAVQSGRWSGGSSAQNREAASGASKPSVSTSSTSTARVSSQTLAQFIDNPLNINAKPTDSLSELTSRLKRAGWNATLWKTGGIGVKLTGMFSLDGIAAERVEIYNGSKMVFKFSEQYKKGGEGLQAVVVEFLRITDQLKELGYKVTKEESDWNEYAYNKPVQYPENRIYEAPGKRTVKIQIQTDCNGNIPRSQWGYRILFYVYP